MFEEMKEFGFLKQKPVWTNHELYNVLFDRDTGRIFFATDSINTPITYDEHTHVKEKLHELVKNNFFEEEEEYFIEMLEFI